MAGENNPFYVAPPNILQALMAGVQGHQMGSGIAEQSRQREARTLAEQEFAKGNTQGAIARLLGAGDSKTIGALGQYQAGANSANSVYGTPIYGTDAQGNTVLGAIGKQGEFRRIDTGGVTPTPGVKMLDTGTGFVPVQSRTGQPMQGGTYNPQTSPQPGTPQPQIGYIPKDVAGEARQKKVGAEEGEVQVNLAAMRSKLPGLKAVVKKLGEIGDKATYTTAGQLLDYGRTQANLPPRESAIARTTYIAMVDNQVLPLLRETFGAQFTQKEGESLKTTLGDPNKSPKEKRAVLDAFIEQKIRNVSSLERQLEGGNASPGLPKVGEVRDGYRYRGGDPASPESWVNTRLK